jgi:hypothetical protein
VDLGRQKDGGQTSVFKGLNSLYYKQNADFVFWEFFTKFNEKIKHVVFDEVQFLM